MTSPLTSLRKYPELTGKTFLVGVGGTKCATSWVFSYLESLPGVRPSPLKEVHFFDTKFSSTAAQLDLFAMKRLAFHFRQDGDVIDNLRSRPAFQASVERVKMIYDDDEYFAHFAGLCTLDTRTLCDITPAYSAIGQSGFQYMKEFFASQDAALKLVFIMRDPVNRLWSHLRYRDQNTADLDVMQSWPDMIRDPEIMGLADYQQTVEALDAVFPEQDILYLFYEDLFGEESLKRLCRFANANFAAPETREAVNETTLKIELPDHIRSELQAVLEPQYTFCRQRFGAEVPSSWAE